MYIVRTGVHDFPLDQLSLLLDQKVYHVKHLSTHFLSLIFEIVDVMRREQACVEMKLDQFTAGATQPSRKKRYIKKEESNSLTTLRTENIL